MTPFPNEIIHESFFSLGDDQQYHLECIFISNFHFLTEPVSYGWELGAAGRNI